MEIVIAMMMIWIIRAGEHHTPSITELMSTIHLQLLWCHGFWCHVICFVLKHFKCKQYFTFSPSILFFVKHFSCKFKAVKHMKELRPPNFKIKTSLGSIYSVLDRSGLILQNFSPAKFFKFKFLPLVKDYPRIITLYCLTDM